MKARIKNGTGVTVTLSSNMVCDSNNETYFPHKILLTNTQVSRLHKAFTNGSSANIKLSKNPLSSIGQLGEFLGRLLGPLLKTVLPLMNNVLKQLAKSILMPLGLTAAASARDAAIQNKLFGSCLTTLIISNEETNDIINIVKSLEDAGLMIKGVS